MIVEKSVKDKYFLTDWLSCTSATTTKQVLLTATRPQKLRINRWIIAARGSQTTPVWTTCQGVLVLVQEGFTAGSVSVPIGVGVADVYEPAANVLWADTWMVMDSNGGTGPGTFHTVWEGDGKTIDMKEGDAIWWAAKTDEAVGQRLGCNLILDIVG